MLFFLMYCIWACNSVGVYILTPQLREKLKISGRLVCYLSNNKENIQMVIQYLTLKDFKEVEVNLHTTRGIIWPL